MAQQQTPQEKADAALTKMWPGIQLRMDEFLAVNERYFQGIRTPVIVPLNGNEAVVDKSVHPTDQVEDWNSFDIHGNISNTLPCSIELHIHNGPQGIGYTFYGWIIDDVGTWLRAQGSGPDSQTFPWRLSLPMH